LDVVSEMNASTRSPITIAKDPIPISNVLVTLESPLLKIPCTMLKIPIINTTIPGYVAQGGDMSDMFRKRYTEKLTINPPSTNFMALTLLDF
jgi:hypothetical protein